MHAALWAKLLAVSRIAASAASAALVFGVLGACTPSAIAWEDVTELPADPLPAGPSDLLPAAFLRVSCPQLVRLAHDSSAGGHYAAWWAVRPDSTADLIVAHSDDGSTWEAPVKVDTLDAGRSGCQRPAPAIAADAGNVHVAYAMAAREGPGIFASHSMDRGKMFHSPVAVVYGERIGRTAIAARGDLVAVAFEDPNTNPRRIGLAISKTMAHLFQARALVSPPTGEASAPRVALRDTTVTGTWAAVPREATVPRRFMRRGTIR